MIPQLPSTQLGERKTLALAPPAPPRGFRPVIGKVLQVKVDKLCFMPPSARTAAQRAGMRYEDKAQDWLSALFGPDYYRCPWIRFLEQTEFGDNQRAVVPDGLLIRGKSAFIFEIKIRHTSDAWWQLRKLYAPVVMELPFVEQVRLVEIGGSFDPLVQMPEEFTRILDLEAFVREPWMDFGVYIWTP